MTDQSWMRAAARALVLVTLLAGIPSIAMAEDAVSMSGVVNVNTATVEELELLPGIGPVKARAILEARRSNGGFKSLGELQSVKGIGESAVERLRAHARVSGKTTAKRE